MASVHLWLQHRLVVPVALTLCAVAALSLVFAGVWMPPLLMVILAVVIVLSLLAAWASFLLRFMYAEHDDRPLGVIARENSLGAWMQEHTGRLRAIRKSLPAPQALAPTRRRRDSETMPVLGPVALADQLALPSAAERSVPPVGVGRDLAATGGGRDLAAVGSGRDMPAMGMRRSAMARSRSAIPLGAGFAVPPQGLPASRPYRTHIPALPSATVRDTDSATVQSNDYV